MNKMVLYSLIYIGGVLISSVAQFLLKKSAIVKHESKIKEYMNIRTITAYSIFFMATLITVFSYKELPLSIGPLLGATEYIFIIIISKCFLKEKINTRKSIGIALVLLGIVIYFI